MVTIVLLYIHIPIFVNELYLFGSILFIIRVIIGLTGNGV